MIFNAIQTFYLDRNAVADSSQILLTSIELFFKAKPSTINNVSGLTAPGVCIQLCEVNNDVPDPDKPIGPVVRVPYDKIYAFNDASASSVFKYETPQTLKTNSFYGIVIRFEDEQYKLWKNKQNQFYVGSNVTSSGSTNLTDGSYFEASSGSVLKAINDTDLKYKVNVAKFNTSTISQKIANKNYEFLSLTNLNGSFRGGEYVYQLTANSTGTISLNAGNTTIKGSGTNFNALLQDTYIVVQSGVKKEVLMIDQIVDSNTIITFSPTSITNTSSTFASAPVGRVFYSDGLNKKLYLVDSSANSSLKFGAANSIIGEISSANASIATVDALTVDRFIPKIITKADSNIDTKISYVFSYDNAGLPTVNELDYRNVDMTNINNVGNYAGKIYSRSLEVSANNLVDHKSALIKFDFESKVTNPFVAPVIQTGDLDVVVIKNNLDATTEVSGVDTEIGKSGVAKNRYISNKVAFANNRFAEDLRVYLNAYRPKETEIKVYAKIHNSSDNETFDDKSWTPLEMKENGLRYSSSNSDIVEYTLGLPKQPPVDVSLAGSYTSQFANNIITANGGNPSLTLSPNDVITLRSVLFPENYHVGIVQSVSNTAITLTAPIANNNVAGSGFIVDKSKYKTTAFNNRLNDNVTRYFNTSGGIYDGYDGMQIKIVLLSNNSNIAPEVESIQVLGVSA